MKNRALFLIGLTGAVLFILFVWPTMYRYDHQGRNEHLVRTNRVTGTSEFLTVHGWERPEPSTRMAQ